VDDVVPQNDDGDDHRNVYGDDDGYGDVAAVPAVVLGLIQD